MQTVVKNWVIIEDDNSIIKAKMQEAIEKLESPYTDGSRNSIHDVEMMEKIL